MALRPHGRYPNLEDILEYYSRNDVCTALYENISTRKVLFKWEIGRKRHAIPCSTSSPDDLKSLILKSLSHFDSATKFKRYPYFLADSARYSSNIAAWERSKPPWGFDFLLETDGSSYKDNFDKLRYVIEILDEYGIPHRSKFSGSTSLHLNIPAEVFPKELGGLPLLYRWPQVDAALAAYLRVFGRAEIEHGTTATLPYSLSRKTGMVSMPLNKYELERFSPWQANIHQVDDVRLDEDFPKDAPERMKAFLKRTLDWQEPQLSDFRKEEEELRAINTERLERAAFKARVESNSRPVTYWERLLNSSDEKERVMAAWNLIWHLNTQDVSKAIVEHLKDESPDVRWFLITIMGLYPQSFSRDVKEGVLNSAKDKYEGSSVEDLLVVDKEKGLDILLVGLSKKGGRWSVQHEVSALRRINPPKSLLYKLLESESLGIRIAAAIVLGRKGDRASVNKLTWLLKDPNREVKLAAISALGLIGDPSAIEVLADNLRKDHATVRRKSVQALSRINDVHALDILLAGALHNPSFHVRAEAVKALHGRSGEVIDQVLFKAFNDRSANVRLYALRVLARRDHAIAMNAIQRALIDTKEVVRKEAEQLLKQFQSGDFLVWFPFNHV